MTVPSDEKILAALEGIVKLSPSYFAHFCNSFCEKDKLSQLNKSFFERPLLDNGMSP
jgi:hypothetical protein